VRPRGAPSCRIRRLGTGPSVHRPLLPCDCSGILKNPGNPSEGTHSPALPFSPSQRLAAECVCCTLLSRNPRASRLQKHRANSTGTFLPTVHGPRSREAKACEERDTDHEQHTAAGDWPKAVIDTHSRIDSPSFVFCCTYIHMAYPRRNLERRKENRPIRWSLSPLRYAGLICGGACCTRRVGYWKSRLGCVCQPWRTFGRGHVKLPTALRPAGVVERKKKNPCSVSLLLSSIRDGGVVVRTIRG